MKQTLITFSLLLITLPTFSQNVESVIKKYLSAIGLGHDSDLKIHTRIDKAYSIKYHPLDTSIINDTSKSVTYYKHPNKSRFIDGNSSLNYDGETYWRENENGSVSILPSEHGKYYASTISSGFHEFFLADDAEIEYLGVKNIEEKNFYVLKLKKRAWIFAQLDYFDKETGLLIFSHQEDRNISMGTHFKDYKEEDGVLLPHLEEFYRDGNLQSRTVLNIAINVALPDSMFQVPNQ